MMWVYLYMGIGGALIRLIHCSVRYVWICACCCSSLLERINLIWNAYGRAIYLFINVCVFSLFLWIFHFFFWSVCSYLFWGGGRKGGKEGGREGKFYWFWLKRFISGLVFRVMAKRQGCVCVCVCVLIYILMLFLTFGIWIWMIYVSFER